MKSLTCVLVAFAASTAPAVASFPGRNGDLAVASPFQQTRHIVEIDVRTGDKDWLTQPGHLPERRETFAPEYFPDGRRFLFVRRGGDYQPSLWSAAREGGDALMHASRIDMTQGMNAPGPSLSPDGRRIVYSRFGGIFTARIDGSDERELRRERRCTRPDGTVDVPECDFTRAPVWSPDGRWIAVERTGGAVDADEGGIWLMSARDGRLVRQLSRYGEDVDWSPDSRRLVFAEAGGDSGSGGDLYSVRTAGGGLRRLTRGRLNDAAPAWSPNGKWIAWVRIRWEDPVESLDGPEEMSVWRRRVAGGKAMRIAKLPRPYADEGFFEVPTLSWQPLPRR